MGNEKRLVYVEEVERLINGLDSLPWEEDVQELVSYLTTVDTVAVVHGRWEKASEYMPIYRCSICKERNLFKNGDNVLSNYCPNCGAKMTEVNNE